jgi:hypothetical protein
MISARVSSSVRSCGRPRLRHAVRAMLLNDDCHSIDSFNMGVILENVKFPNIRLNKENRYFRLFPGG